MSMMISSKFASAANYVKRLKWDIRSSQDVTKFQNSLENKIKTIPPLSNKVVKATAE
ncbi:hypothetical protein HIM_04168 [Hirsutella minnesotensis 3608]|uniref:Uncharacterized protein n=1 Tax=Hirsutella minnesotensis 3608 TaxID=1043627 RepID=A0A0F8A645_9HYPO|nr:hypothetical protein HIM_04168 [Hirsutella minnesotensis 3608]